jgi:hypothetical protein
MRKFGYMLCGVVAGACLWSGVIAAPAASPADCRKVGSEVSALIDKSSTSRASASAKAAFQIGIMDCMEGDDAAANRHYQDAKTLLGVATPVTPLAVNVQEEANCQKTGSEVSALIDNSAGSRNLPGARAAFQIGIMECMEGDDVNANKHYQDAKELLRSE